MRCNTELGVWLKNYPSFTAAEPPDRKLSNPSFVAPANAMSFTYTQESSWTLHHDTCSQQEEESIFTLHRIHHFSFRQIVGQPLSSVSTCHLTDRSGKIIWWKKPSLPFPGSLDTASRSSKSFLFISGTILTGCRREAKMSTSIPAAAGAAH